MLQAISTRMVPPCLENDKALSEQNWSSEFGSRLTIFCGDNGLGKSVILELIWYILTFSWFNKPIIPYQSSTTRIRSKRRSKQNSKSGLEKEPQEAIIHGALSFLNTDLNHSAKYDFEKEEWLHTPPPKAHSGIVIFAGPNGNYAVWDSDRTPISEAKYENAAFWGSDRNAKLPPNFKFTSEDVLYGIRDKDTVWCRGLLNDWIIWKHDKQWRQIYNIFEAILETLSPASETMKPGDIERFSVIDSEIYPLLKLPYGNIPIHLLSSGMRRILEIAYLMIWASVEGSTTNAFRKEGTDKDITVIVDEIELHLHPKWQRTVLPSLLKAVTSLAGVFPRIRQKPKIQLFVTTHSPLVLASLETTFDDNTDKVKILEYDKVKNSIGLAQYNMSKVGDVSAWLTSQIFGLGSARSIEAENAIIQAKHFIGHPSNQKSKTIEKQLLLTLADSDPFWVIWNLRKIVSGGIENID